MHTLKEYQPAVTQWIWSHSSPVSGIVWKEAFSPKQRQAITFLMFEHPFASRNLNTPLIDTSGKRLFVLSVLSSSLFNIFLLKSFRNLWVLDLLQEECHSICHAEWKKKNNPEKPILPRNRNQRAGWKQSSSVQSQNVFGLKRQSIPPKWIKTTPTVSAWCEEVSSKHPFPHGSDSPLSMKCTQTPLLQCQHCCTESMAETGECCFLKVTAHYHSWLQQ